MPYQTNIPNSAQSPGIFPAQSIDNFTRLKTIISSNHKFNDSAAADDGYHQNIKMLPIAVPSSDNTVGQAFANSSDATGPLTYVDQANTRFQITPTIPIYAAVKFTGTGGSPFTILFSHNVTSVTQHTSSGQYILTFTRPLPSQNYIVLGNVQPASGGTGYVQSLATNTYSQVFNTLFTIVETRTLAGSLTQFPTVQISIFGG